MRRHDPAHGLASASPPSLWSRILAAMLPLLRALRFWLGLRAPETSRLIVGSTGSGKSEGELADLHARLDQLHHTGVD